MLSTWLRSSSYLKLRERYRIEVLDVDVYRDAGTREYDVAREMGVDGESLVTHSARRRHHGVQVFGMPVPVNPYMKSSTYAFPINRLAADGFSAQASFTYNTYRYAK